MRSLFGFRGLDGLLQGAISAVGHADHDDLAVDVDLPLLEVDVPAATGRAEGVGTVVPGHRAFARDRTILGHAGTSFLNALQTR